MTVRDGGENVSDRQQVVRRTEADRRDPFASGARRVAGNALRVAQDLESSNYVEGVSGWKLERSTGNVEFGEGSFRGTVNAESGTIEGDMDVLGALRAESETTDAVVQSEWADGKQRFLSGAPAADPSTYGVAGSIAPIYDANNSGESFLRIAGYDLPAAELEDLTVMPGGAHITVGQDRRVNLFSVSEDEMNQSSLTVGENSVGFFSTGDIFVGASTFKQAGGLATDGKVTIASATYRDHLKIERGTATAQAVEMSLSTTTALGLNPSTDGLRFIGEAGNMMAVIADNGIATAGRYQSPTGADGGFRVGNQNVAGIAGESGTGTGGGLSYDSDVLAIRRGSVAQVINRVTSATATTAMLSMRYRGTQVGSIGVSSTATAFNTTSDYRLKENARPIDTPLVLLGRLNPITFDWKDQPEVGPTQGFLAHEVAEVVPDAVTGEKDAVDGDGEIDAQSVDHSKLVPLLVAAVQELTARVQELEATVSACCEGEE